MSKIHDKWQILSTKVNGWTELSTSLVQKNDDHLFSKNLLTIFWKVDECTSQIFIQTHIFFHTAPVLNQNVINLTHYHSSQITTSYILFTFISQIPCSPNHLQTTHIHFPFPLYVHCWPMAMCKKLNCWNTYLCIPTPTFRIFSHSRIYFNSEGKSVIKLFQILAVLKTQMILSKFMICKNIL